MSKSVEIDFIVKDSLEAIELYEKIFDIKRIEVTDFSKGLNEAIFSIYDTTFHMLDENSEFQLFAPTSDNKISIWFNVTVEDIKDTHEKALANGSIEIQDIVEIKEFGVSNSIFMDKFGYMWMLHQIHTEVSFEKRMEIMREAQGSE